MYRTISEITVQRERLDEYRLWKKNNKTDRVRNIRDR